MKAGSKRSKAKSSDELEREARLKRQQIEATLDDLNQELSPGQLLDDYYFHGEGFTGYLRHVKEDPIPAMLIGTAIAWTAGGDELKHEIADVGQAAKSKMVDAKDALARKKEAAQDRISDTRDALLEKKDAVTGKVTETRDKLVATKDTVEEKWEQTTQKAADAAERGKQTLRQHPLMAMAAGFSLGAALGGLTPVTATEEETLAVASRKLKEVTGRNSRSV